MSMSVDQLTAQPKTIELGGRALRLAPLTMDDLGVLQAWIHSQLPDPVAVAHRLAQGMPESVQQKIIDRAFDHAMAAKKTHMIGTAEADEFLATMAGFVRILALMCRADHPEMTAEVLAPLVGGLDRDRINAISMHAFGVAPTAADFMPPGAGAGDPKAAGRAGANGVAAPSTTSASS